MDRLSYFYLELTTDINKLHAFNMSAENRRHMLTEAQIDNADELLTMDKETLRQTLAKELIKQTGDWKGLNMAAGNSDNKGNWGKPRKEHKFN